MAGSAVAIVEDGRQRSRKIAKVYLHSCALADERSVIVAEENLRVDVMRERRTAVMIVVEATWEDHSGALRTIAARIENKSAGGVCLRVPTPIAVGSRLKIQWRWEQFSGVARYCVSDGMDYLVGVQRDGANTQIVERCALAVLQEIPQLTAKSSEPPAEKTPTAREQTREKVRDSKPRKIRAASKKPISRMKEKDPGVRREVKRHTKQNPSQPISEEGTLMGRSWLWKNKQEAADGNGNGKNEGNGSGKESGEGANPHGERTLQLAPLPERAPATPTEEGAARAQVEYMSMEDIYSAAGIICLRRGYSIKKVVEMLRSEHLRGLSKEMKRAAVLMALDAASITVAEVLGDAKLRQEALDSYEGGQRKRAEAEWARKAEEIVQIEAELERVKEQYAARISRHHDAVAREKGAFNSWQKVKQQESQSMLEASELCLRSPLGETGTGSRSDVSLISASTRTM